MYTLNQNRIVEVAKQYVGRGLSVIAVKKDKTPVIAWKEFQERRATVEEVDAWFLTYPDANIAIVTGSISGLCVIDFDTQEAFETAKVKGLPNAPLVKTARGFHAYFKYQDGARNFQKRADLLNVDFRGDGGYVVAPPSIHESGSSYAWVNGCSLDDLPLAELPDWVLAQDSSEKTSLDDLLKGVAKGERNNGLARLTGSWLGQGLGFEECLNEAIIWNQKNQPPLSDKEVSAVVESIVKKHQKELEDHQDDEADVKETSFIHLTDGRLAEMIFDKDSEHTSFAVYDARTGHVAVVDSLEDRGKIIYPIPPNPIFNSPTPSVWFSSKAEPYATDKELFDEVKGFIGRYLIIDPNFLNLATSYAMLTWLYDCFSVLAYLRVLGDFGTGKSRFLQTIGSVCYKPMMCTGAIGAAPIFRIIERYKGTLILDEFNIQDSNFNIEIIQILNSGYEKKAPVLRCVGDKHEVQSFQVFGPKIISSRNKWKDTALESRCITWLSSMSKKAPLSLDDKFDSDALALRNKLLMYRFRNYGAKTLDASKFTCPVEPRIQQILLPLISMSQDQEIISQINEVANNLQKEIVAERANSQAFRVLEAIKEIEDARPDKGEKIYLTEIFRTVNSGVPERYMMKPVTISRVCRSPELNIQIEKKDSEGRSIICRPQQMDALYQKYGIEQ